jgi:hypothetical protein
MTAPPKISKPAVIACAIVAVLLFFFNGRSARFETVEQRNFEQWLEVQDRPERTTAPASAPVTNLVVSLSGKRALDEPPIRWELRSSEGEEARERALRILQMAREANLFSIGVSSVGEIGLTLEVQEEGRVFRTVITDQITATNLRVATLLRLFQEYALTPVPTVVAVQGQTGEPASTLP